MFVLLKFPIYALDGWQFSITSNIINYNIILHIHKLPILTIKINNFLSIALNYKLKFYKIINVNSSKSISLIKKSNKKHRDQKGFGRARVGLLKSSMHRGGGVIFGPKPHFTRLKINIKEWICIYKSFLINKRFHILWFFINKTLLFYKKKNFLQNFTQHIGISIKEKIVFLIICKSFLYKKNFTQQIWFYNINLLNFLRSKYIIYLI